MNDRGEIKRSYILLLLACYIILLVWVIVFKCNQNFELHIDKNLAMPLWERFTARLIPFKDVYVSLVTQNVGDILAIIFNVICLLPMGIFLSFFVSKRCGILLSLSFVVAIEVFQLFSGWGGFDPTDIFLNVLGTYLGFKIFDALYLKITARNINRISGTLIIPTVFLTVFACISTVLNFPV